LLCGEAQQLGGAGLGWHGGMVAKCTSCMEVVHDRDFRTRHSVRDPMTSFPVWTPRCLRRPS
jgi:hypothetical protein